MQNISKYCKYNNGYCYKKQQLIKQYEESKDRHIDVHDS